MERARERLYKPNEIKASRSKVSKEPAFLIKPNRRPDRLRDVVRMPIDLRQFAPFDQKPDFRFRPGVTQQHSSLAAELLFHSGDEFHHLRQSFQRRFFFYAQVALRLWIFR